MNSPIHPTTPCLPAIVLVFLGLIQSRLSQISLLPFRLLSPICVAARLYWRTYMKRCSSNTRKLKLKGSSCCLQPRPWRNFCQVQSYSWPQLELTPKSLLGTNLEINLISISTALQIEQNSYVLLSSKHLYNLQICGMLLMFFLKNST